MPSSAIGHYTDAGQTWLALTADQLPVGPAYEWAVQPNCGAVVLFSGTIRDHAEGRSGVQSLTYEAYEEQALLKMAEVATEMRHRYPAVGRIVFLHRLGEMAVGESSVIVVVSAPHRPEAFDAARFAIDALKVSVPIWKHEVWETGADWGTGAHDLMPVNSVAPVAQSINPTQGSLHQ